MRAAVLASVLLACGNDVAPPDAPPGAPTFAAIESEIFSKSCAFPSCHGGNVAAARLDLAVDPCRALVGRTSCLYPDRRLVVPGMPEASFLMDKLYGGERLVAVPPDPACADSNFQMPYGAKALTRGQLAQLEAWIRDGAECVGSVQYDAGVDGSDATATATEADIASITAAATAIRAGTAVEVTVALVTPAPPGGQTIVIDVGDVTALGAPSAIHVDPGVTELRFNVIGKRPARPTMVRATGKTNSRAVAIGVTGLALVELFADPVGTDDRLQWFKLANLTDVAIDLRSYTVGAGRTSYQFAMTQLAGIIAPHGCAVIGGPSSTTANGNPSYTQIFNFSPDLPSGSDASGQGTGTALFDVPITAVTPTTIPIDSVLCGSTNAAGLIGTSGTPALPNCPDIAAGHSVSRTTPAVWVDLATPSPGLCPST